MSSKIINALPELVEKKIITAEIAENITTYYTTSESTNSNRLFTLFGILGATLVGLGLILIMAHNWDDFPKIIKLILAFLPMLVGQTILGVSIFKDKSIAWKESSIVFLYFSVGLCIALVSQIYHVSGDLESFLLAWIVLCVPLLYLTKSSSVIILHLIFITYYAFNAGSGFRYSANTTIPHIYFLLLALPMPTYFKMIKSGVKSPAKNILHWLFPLSLMFSLPICIDRSEGIGYLMYILLFGIFYNIGQFPYFKNKSLLQNGYRSLGSLGTVFLLLTLSFRFIWENEFQDVYFYSLEFFCAMILFVIASVLLYFNSKNKTFQKSNLFQFIFLIFTIIFMIGLFDDILATVLINILLFIIGILSIKAGAETFDFGKLNYGMLIITILIACRFFDTEMTFAIRGLLFILIGGGFFAANYIMLKKQKSKKI
jgi:uncharacterized membrane protein